MGKKYFFIRPPEPCKLWKYIADADYLNKQKTFIYENSKKAMKIMEVRNECL